MFTSWLICGLETWSPWTGGMAFGSMRVAIYQVGFADCAALYALKELKLSFQISDFGIMQNIRKGWGYVDDQKITTHPIQTTGFIFYSLVANTE